MIYFTTLMKGGGKDEYAYIGWLLIFVGLFLGFVSIAIIKELGRDDGMAIMGLVMLLAAVCALVCGISVLRKNPKE